MCEMGYVRVAFGALLVESQCSCCRADLLKPVETPQVQFLDKALTMTSCSFGG